MTKAETDTHSQVLHWISHLAYPFLVASIYFLTASFFSEQKAVREAMVGNGLLFLGFGLGLQTLRKRPRLLSTKRETQKYIGLVFAFFAMALLILAVVVFLVKDGGIYNSLGLGLCSCAVGMLGVAKEQMGLLSSTTGEVQ